MSEFSPIEEDLIPFMMAELKTTRKEMQNALQKAQKILEHKAEIDAEIRGLSTEYQIDRISRAELTILRLGLFEILFEKDLYRNNMKHWEFGKEGSQNPHSEQATIARGQGASENANVETTQTTPKTDSSCCFGIPPKVAIAEGIRLCRKFGTNESAQFVNAILDGVYKKHAPVPLESASV